MRYILIILISLLVGCGTTSTQQRSKSLNTANLVKTNYGTYKLKTIEDYKLEKGLTIKDKESVKEIDLVAEQKKTLLPPKQQQLVNESTVGLINIGIPKSKEPVNQEESKPIVSVNWLNLVMFYLLAGWILFIVWTTFKTVRQYFKKEENPFAKKEDKKDDKPTSSNT